MSVRDRDDLVVARLHELAPHLDGEPDPAWQATTRARLVAMAAVRSPEPEPVSSWRRFLSGAEDAAPSRWRGRLTAGLAGAAMAVTAMATLVAVSTDAGPGDPLYGIKRGTEQTQLALAGDGRGQTLLDFARTRLHELEELTGSGVTALVLETLATMDAQTTEGAAFLTDRSVETGDDAPLDLLAAWSADQTVGLTALRKALPDSTVDELDGSLARLAAISTRTVALTDVLGCTAGVPVEATDQFGPVPGLCLPEDTGTPPVADGEEDPGTVPTPGEGSDSEGTATVPTPGAPGGGTSAGEATDEGSGGGSGGGLPETDQPSVDVPGLPLPTTLPTLPTGLPGGSTTSGSSATSSSTTSAPLDIDLCLGPIVVGDCD